MVAVKVRARTVSGRRKWAAIAADLADPDPGALRSAVEGADVVLSGLGARSSSEIGIATQGTHAIAQAMEATGARRVIVVSAAPISTVPAPGRRNPPKRDPGEGPFMRNVLTPFAMLVFRRRYADLALMEGVLRDSNLDWTVVRPPRLTDGPLTGIYRTAFGRNLHGGLVISRADVAHLMLRVADQPETIRNAVGIAY